MMFVFSNRSNDANEVLQINFLFDLSICFSFCGIYIFDSFFGFGCPNIHVFIRHRSIDRSTVILFYIDKFHSCHVDVDVDGIHPETNNEQKNVDEQIIC